MTCACRAAALGEPCTCAFTLPEEHVGQTLVDSLVPTVDCIRDLYAELGLRPYQIMLVWSRWSGGERGRGQESVLAIWPILPTPKLQDLSAVRTQLIEIGQNEQGTVRVEQISMRYSEDLLLGRGGPLPEGREIPRDVSFYWEVLLPDGVGSGVRRRFFPVSVPSRNAMKFEWALELREIEGPRDRDGRPAQP